MKKLPILILLLSTLTANAQNCTEETVLKEPGRYLDNYTGKGLRKEAFTPVEIANARKTLTAIAGLCKKNLVFTGGQAKASFMLNSKGHYNQQTAGSYMYNLGFHAFVCHVQTRQLRIVDEYANVLRITVNPGFERATFSFDSDAPAFRNPMNSQDIHAPRININGHYAFGNAAIVDAINNGKGFIDLSDELIAPNTMLAENRPGKGYGFVLGNSFEKAHGTSYVYRHWYLTHTDIPFLIPVTRKKFLQDLLEYYEREKSALSLEVQRQIKLYQSYIASDKKNGYSSENNENFLAKLQGDAAEINTVNEKKKAYAQNLLSSKDENWLNEPAAVAKENKTFTTYDSVNKRSKESTWGRFYFTEFYTGKNGVYLYYINPDYLKKYPPASAKPSVLKIMYRFRATEAFGISVNESYIIKLDINGLRKLLD